MSAAFGLWWFITLALGTIFLVGTGREWHRMIFEKGLTISTNLFGTTYYSLVGLHAFHVTVGLIGIALAMVFTLLGKVKSEHSERAGSFFVVLAFRRRGLGDCVHRGLHHRPLRKAKSHGFCRFTSGRARDDAGHGHSARADRLAHRPRVRHHSALGGAGHQPFGEHSRSNPGRERECRLVSGCPPAREGRDG